MTSRPRISDDDRRRRLARRHAVAPAHRVGDPLSAARAMTVLHATEPPTVHLSILARVHQVGVADIDRALYTDRTLIKQLAMRRTLFVFPRESLAAGLASASARVAAAEERRIVKAVEAGGLTGDGAGWLERACAAVLAEVERSDGLSAQQIRERVPQVQGKVHVSPGTRWSASVNVQTWVANLLSLRGRLVRGPAVGHWRNPRPLWVTATDWYGGPVGSLSSADGYAELVRGWLARFGPGTEADLVWWLGATKTAVRQAMSEIGAVPVVLDDGATGYVLAGDEEPEPEVEPWAALLPILDPTTMGWRGRNFYLDPADVPYLFDSVGNAGTTAWWDGRIVGCWVQDPDAAVRVIPRRVLPADATRALAVEADRLTSWLAGDVVTSVYSSRQMKAERLP